MKNLGIAHLISMALTVQSRNQQPVVVSSAAKYALEDFQPMSFGTKCSADTYVSCLIQCRRTIRKRRHNFIKSFKTKQEHAAYFSKREIRKRVVNFSLNDYCFWHEEESARAEFNNEARGKK